MVGGNISSYEFAEAGDFFLPTLKFFFGSLCIVNNTYYNVVSEIKAHCFLVHNPRLTGAIKKTTPNANVDFVTNS